MYHVGCDQHKKYSFVVSKDLDGNTIDQLKLYHADKDKVKEYFEGLPKDSVVALEACGFDWWLGDMIEEVGLGVKLAHTAKTKAIAEEKIKTDKISAGVLSDLLRADLLPQAYRAPREIRDQRILLRYRMGLIRIRTSIKNRIHSFLDHEGIGQSFGDLFGKMGRMFLKQLELPRLHRSLIDNYLSLIDELNTLILRVDAQLRKQSLPVMRGRSY